MKAPIPAIETERSWRDRHALGLIFIIGCSILACHILWLPRIVVDDAFISYRYANNLVEGHGLIFNPGERVEGYSNFLWVLLTALGMLANLEPVAWTRSLGVTALMGSLLVAAHMVKRLTHSNWAALGVALMLAASTALCGSAMSGLETGLYMLLVTCTAACGTAGRYWQASVLIGLAALTRPEGAAMCIVGLALLPMVRGLRACRRDAIALAVPCGVIVGALLLFRLVYFGHWMPNSVQAKSVLLPLLWEAAPADWSGLVFNEKGLNYAGDFIRYAFGVAFLFAFVPVVRARGRRWTALFLLGIAAMGLAVAVYNFGDWMSSFRLLTPYLPICAVLVVWGMAETLSWLQGIGRAAWLGVGRVVVVGLALSCAAGQFQPRRPAVNRNPDVELALALSASRQPDLLAATDVLGRLGYYAPGVRIIDMAGLTEAHIARFGTPRPPFGRSDFDYVLRRRPHFIMNNVRTAWRRHLHKAAFVDDYLWVDRAAWTRPLDPAGRPRFVFVRRGCVLEAELRRRYPNAVFRPPVELGPVESSAD